MKKISIKLAALCAVTALVFGLTPMGNLFYRLAGLSDAAKADVNFIESTGQLQLSGNVTSAEVSPYNDNVKVKSIVALEGTVLPESCYSLFYNNKALTIDLSKADTSNVTSMNCMFKYCYNATSINVSKFNTSKVTKMYGMFDYCTSLTSLDLTSFDTSNVTDMSYFLRGTKIVSLDVTKFNTSNVRDMSRMFENNANLQILDVSHFDTSKVTDMSYMFYMDNVLNSIDVSHFDTSNVTNMSGMFYWCQRLKVIDVSHFNTSKVKDMSHMFEGCKAVTSLNVSNFNTSNVTTFQTMFSTCQSLTSLDVSSFDTRKATNMGSMFSSTSYLEHLDLSNFDTRNVTNTWFMFAYCSSLRTVKVSERWKLDKVTYSENMFLSSPNVKGERGTKMNASYVDKTYARIDKEGAPGYFLGEYATMKSVSGNFTGKMELNLYIDVPDSLTKFDGSYAMIGFEGETAKKCLLSDAPRSAEGWYKISFPVVAKRMQDNVIIRLYDGDDIPMNLTDGSKVDYTETGYKITFMKYLDMAIAQGGKMKPLAMAAKDYGKAAQQYFKYRTSEAGIDVSLSSAVTGLNASVFDQFAIQKTGKMPSGLKGVSVSVVFSDNNALRVYYSFDKNVNYKNYTYKKNGAKVTPTEGSGGYFLVKKNIPGRSLGDTQTFSISNGKNTYTYKLSVLTYAGAMAGPGNSEEAQNLAKALYLYYQAAAAYFGN